MKKHSSWISALMAAVLTLVLAVSWSQPAQASGTLKIGMEANYAPYNWTQTTSANGAVKIDGTSSYANGYDVKIAKIIAKKLGKKVIVEKTQWDGLLPALTSGKIDMIIAEMSPTAERR